MGERANPFLRATTQQVADAFGVSATAVNKWRAGNEDAWEKIQAKGGRPVYRWNLPRLIELRTERKLERLRLSLTEERDDDEAFLGYSGTSPALERYRLAKAKKAERENEEEERKIVQRADVEGEMALAGEILKKKLDAVGRRHGGVVANDVAQAVEDAMMAFERVIGDD